MTSNAHGISHSKKPSGVRRVAIVLSELRRGGMERVVVHLATQLKTLGTEPLVICIENEGPFGQYLKDEDIRLVALGSSHGKDLKAVLRLNRVLREFKPDIINVHDYSSLPYVTLANTLRWRRSPIVFTAHGLLYEGFDGLQTRYRFFSRWLTMLAAVSEEVLQRHVGFLDWRGETSIIRNGVPDIGKSMEDRRAVREELDIPEDEFVFVAVGNSRPEKAFEDLAEAADLATRHDAGRKFRVLIAGKIGDDEYSKDVRRRVEAVERGNVHLLGFRSDANRLYSAVDAFVISSRSEGLPMVLLEAMTAGLPVLATRVGGIPGAIPDQAGFLVDPATPSQLARAMSEMMRLSPDELRQMGLAARTETIARYGAQRMAEQYLACYANCRSSKQKPLES